MGLVFAEERREVVGIAAKRLRGQGSAHLGSKREPVGIVNRQRGISSHEGRAVDQGQTLLRTQRKRFQTARIQRLAGQYGLTLAPHRPLTDKDSGKVA